MNNAPNVGNQPGLATTALCLRYSHSGLLTALEDFSQHTQIAALMAEIGMDEQGLALTMVQGGPYLQITSLEEKSFAVNDGKQNQLHMPNRLKGFFSATCEEAMEKQNLC
ncbi:hypothetical protein EK904_009266 [Melospiza melodia maxima]|nr:hypothetical protein EK904_009266 [Melospiza melodia maxima]